MAQLFVSHSSADNTLAAAVEDCLAGLGYESVFLDFDPDKGLVPGQAWRDQLFSNLAGCDAVVFLTTPHSVASAWCHSELALTRWLRKPVLALLVDHADPHPLIADLQGLHVTGEELDPERVRAGLVALGLDREAPWEAGRSPYPGLRAFDESYSAVFFGRDRQVDQLRQLVDPPSRTHEGAVIPVLGPSGSGKSSLVRAGLVPALRVSPDWLVTAPWTPSDSPLAELALALSTAARAHDVDLDAAATTALLQRPGGMADYVRRLREADAATPDTKVLVVVDQAEDLVTITGEAERRAFLTALTTSCREPSPLRVVMTARTDLWDQVAAATSSYAVAMAPTVLHVPPLTRADLAVVIREPARRSHLTLEDGLLERLVDDTGSGDALPLLAFTLARLAADAEDGHLSLAEYDAIGGVQGAIAQRAAEVAHGGRTEADVAEAVLHLVSLTDATPHKRLARGADVPPAQREILDDLAEARLVVVSEVDDQPVYAPAHDALFSAWRPLADLIAARRDDLLLRARLERRAADWRDAGATGSGLLSGLELDQARAWRSRSTDLVTGDVAAYVDASVRRRRTARLVQAGVSVVVAALAVTLVVVLIASARHQRRQADRARVGELVAIAQREQVHDPVAAAIALLEALRIDAGDDATDRLTDHLLAAPARDVVRGDASAAYGGVATGGRLAVAASGVSLTTWDTAGETVRDNLPPAVQVAVRSDGRVAAIIGHDPEVQLYDLAASKPTQLSALATSPEQVAFSPDGALLAVSSGTAVTLWDVHDPTAPVAAGSWTAPEEPTAIAVLDDREVLVSGQAAALLSWDAAASPDGSDAAAVRKIDNLPQGAARIDVDPVHDRVLLGNQLASARLVDLRTGDTLRSFTALDPSLPEGSAARQLAITVVSTLDPETDRVASLDVGARAFVFDADSGDLVSQLSGGHTGFVFQAGFTSDGELVTAGVDGTIRLWDPGAATDAKGQEAKDSATDRLCAVFGGRIDEDSWRLAMGDTPLDRPCPAPSQSRPAPLTVAAG